MSWTTVVTMDGTWQFMADAVIAARLAASQTPLPETSAIRILYVADKDNAGVIRRTTDSLSVAEGEPLAPEETFDDAGNPGNSASLRMWFFKGTPGDKLEVQMVN